VAPSVTSVSEGKNPHYDAIGGSEVIAQLVERFYQHMDTLPEAQTIRAMHAPDLRPMQDVLQRYLCEWLGGPQLYSSERGHPRLRRRHMPFRIGPAERDAWMACMRKALAETVPDAALRAQLEAAFSKVADFMRNDAAHQHVHHAPGEPER
jgi:hemoglobin